jgi:hypothetical protein
VTTLAVKKDSRALKVGFQKNQLIVELADGRVLSAPLEWFPRLLNATKAQLAKHRLIAGGVGIHWPELDEDISVAGLL